MHNVIKLFIIVLLILMCPPLSTADTLHDATVAWDYDSENVPDLAGFRLYQDGEAKCDFADPLLREATCELTMNSGPVTMTLTAYDLAGNESDHSNPAIIDLDPSKPYSVHITIIQKE